ncbi:glycosyltransferase family 2 protein [Jeotgalibacillus campisalis]|uniref:Beta-glycosyltransferase n=1 Tax=Jeotgalibacillus campisalis TaxID=220754 RepID=A0A0C2W8S4_9BACL|nr:glycosyltransferase family A protein [Jeotgalibacillus campisalis]KIL52991.1 beta-glycosyltransferase [Jeotgalibacillus campisalis]
MKTLTIFTPSYNRAYCLNQCYESLTNQSNYDFIWLIIDDGSTDHTKALVDDWIKEGKVEIQYYFQENQGMHGAHNTAYNLITTELNVCIDSDDWMPFDAVEKILRFWKRYGSNKVSGLVGLDAFKDGTVIGTPLPSHLTQSTLFDLYARHGVKGDKKLVYRSELTKRYPYPLFKGEKYVGLAYKYYLLDQEFELLILNEVICTVEYLEDGSSRNMLNQYVKNPHGFAFYRKELMKLPFVSAAFKFRQAIHYVSSSMMSKNKGFLKESPSPVLTFLAMPLGALLYLYISAKSTAAM